VGFVAWDQYLEQKLKDWELEADLKAERKKALKQQQEQEAGNHA